MRNERLRHAKIAKNKYRRNRKKKELRRHGNRTNTISRRQWKEALVSSKKKHTRMEAETKSRAILSKPKLFNLKRYLEDRKKTKEQRKADDAALAALSALSGELGGKNGEHEKGKDAADIHGELLQDQREDSLWESGKHFEGVEKSEATLGQRIHSDIPSMQQLPNGLRKE